MLIECLFPARPSRRGGRRAQTLPLTLKISAVVREVGKVQQENEDNGRQLLKVMEQHRGQGSVWLTRVTAWKNGGLFGLGPSVAPMRMHR